MSEPTAAQLSGYLRGDGRKGIRNLVVVAYLVECAHHVAREITAAFRHQPVHLVGFPGCFPNDYAEKVLVTKSCKQSKSVLAQLELKEFSVLHLKHNSLVDTASKKFKAHQLMPMYMPSCFAPMTPVSPSSLTLRV